MGGGGGTARQKGLCCKKGLEGFFLLRNVHLKHFPVSSSLKLRLGQEQGTWSQERAWAWPGSPPLGLRGARAAVVPHPVLRGPQSLGRDVGSVPGAVVDIEMAWAD